MIESRACTFTAPLTYTCKEENEKVGTAPPQFKISRDKLIQRLSYSHLELIVDLDDDLKRTFYEIECIRGNWSVRELKRQIGSLYYERSGLSKDKTKLAKLTQKGAETTKGITLWWSMHWPAWTICFSFPNTSLNCQRKRKCSGLLKKNIEKLWMSTNDEMANK